MKNYLFLLLITLMTNCLVAQKTIESGYIKMEITEMSAEDPQMQAGLSMMEGTQTEYFFNQEKSLVKQTMMGGMVSNSTLMNTKTGKMDMYFDMMGQKMHVETSKEEMESQNNSETDVLVKDKMDVVYDKTATKEILGYKCHKATIEGQGGLKLICYITDQIKADNTIVQGLSDLNIDGFPLEVATNVNGTKFVFTTTEITEALDPEVFNVKTEGFKKMTFKEFSESLGQMGAGMGF